jgi:ferric-dicitrate binding protein FerR (iron transport regulator)
MNIEVLGTRFNINAYDDEPTAKMTLVQGSVKVHPLNKPGAGIVMQPGEQAILSDRSLEVEQVDPAGSIAWVRGVFQLQGVDMKTAMRQIARWYDIEVVFKDDINPRLAGSAYQSEGLQDLLKVIGYASDVKFAVSDKTVFVMKK